MNNTLKPTSASLADPHAHQALPKVKVALSIILFSLGIVLAQVSDVRKTRPLVETPAPQARVAQTHVEPMQSMPAASEEIRSVQSAPMRANQKPAAQAAGRTPGFSTPASNSSLSPEDSSTPSPSLVAFAERLSERMDEAETSIDKARGLFSDLTECVNGDRSQNSNQMQALCLWHALQLSEHYKEFGDAYKALERSAQPAAVEMLKMSDPDAG